MFRDYGNGRESRFTSECICEDGWGFVANKQSEGWSLDGTTLRGDTGVGGFVLNNHQLVRRLRQPRRSLSGQELRPPAHNKHHVGKPPGNPCPRKARSALWWPDNVLSW